MKKFATTFTLTNENIDTTVRDAITCLEGIRIQRKQITTIRLSLEEVLLKLLAAGNQENCSVTLEKIFGKWVFSVKSEGPEFNPLPADSDVDFFSVRLCNALNDYGLTTEYKRKHARNCVFFYLPGKKTNPIVLNFIAIAVAVAFGLLVTGTLSPSQASLIVADFIEPTFNAFISLLSALAAFMIFFSILSSITGMGDLSTFGKYGKTTIGILLRRFVSCGLLSLVFCILFLNILGNDTSINGSIFTDFYKTIIGIIPSDLLSPFISKNTLQITFLAGCFGFIVLLIGPHCENAIQLINDMNVLVSKSISLLCSFMPVCIFLSISKLVIVGDFSKVFKVWKLFVLVLCIGFCDVLFSVTYCSFKHKIPFFKLLSSSYSCGLTGFLTASSFACYDNIHNLVVEQHDVDQKSFDFSFSMASVFCKSSLLLYLLVGSFVLCDIFGITLSPAKLVIAFITILLTTIATPPIPGGTLAVWTSLLALCGLPAEALGIMLTIESFNDMIGTGFYATGLGSIIIHIDRKLKESRN